MFPGAGLAKEFSVFYVNYIYCKSVICITEHYPKINTMKYFIPRHDLFVCHVHTGYSPKRRYRQHKPQLQSGCECDLALREGTAMTVAAGANTLTLPSAKNSVYRLTGASGAFSITSISGGNDGMLLTLINATGQVMTVTNGSIQTNTVLTS